MLFACWKTICQMAPWLLLGMLLSGVLHVLLPPDFIRRKFNGVSGVIKAVLFGVPLPLCSCGVVPAGIGIKNQGASDGAAVGFLISTPQTGVDSILVSASFFGWPFAIFKMIAAAVTGVIGGTLSEQLESGQLVVVDESKSHHDHHHSRGWRGIWEHSLEIIGSVWGWLILGILISAVIEVYLPKEWLVQVADMGLVPTMLLVLVISTPLYVCATASVPIAAALVAGGFPPAAALVFLMAGPATNVTTIGAIYGRFGWRTLFVYLFTIVVGSMVSAWLFDWMLTAELAEGHDHNHDADNWWSHLSGVILLLLLAKFAWADIRRWGKRVFFKDLPGDQIIELTVEGMTCGGCVNRLETTLKNFEAVDEVNIHLKTGNVKIVGAADRSQLVAVVEDAGFRVV